VIKDDVFSAVNFPDKPVTKRLESPLVEGEDYYLENGLYVFTAQFLLRRGYCCDSGCRHLCSIIKSV
jgi:hypothetical protein